jgi:prepilin-type processing-associated H-X9-DG protein
MRLYRTSFLHFGHFHPLEFVSDLVAVRQPGHFILAASEHRHAAGTRAPNGQSRQHAGAPTCGHPARSVEYPGQDSRISDFRLRRAACSAGPRITLRPGARKSYAHGFTHLDLAVVLALVLLVGLWVGCGYVGERGRTSRCARNLAALGKAMHSYAAEHGDALPPAGVLVGKYESSWDLAVVRYLRPGAAKENNAAMAQTVSRTFTCPSDHLSHAGAVRSYSMSSNNMTLQNWPPGPDTATGAGLNWDKGSIQRLLGEDAPEKPESLPGVKLADIPNPARTVLLTEMLSPDNAMGKYQLASISGSAQQRQALTNAGVNIHHGRLNYLMVDGHVEALSMLAAGWDGSGGIWTLKQVR